MEINFKEKFEEVLDEELKVFDIDRSLIEIEYVPNATFLVLCQVYIDS